MTRRIQFLDGLRGVAILLVVLFHAYVNYPERLPFGDRFGVIPLRLGWQGVELFFLISGFVILLTLERSSSALHFAWLRWVRLFPAMLIASVLSLALFQKPWLNLIPGLTFINPSLIHSITRLNVESLNDAFWSLYVEVAFYFAFGSLFFISGANLAIGGVFGLFILSMVIGCFVGDSSSLIGRISAAMDWMGFVHFGWFASGALFYQYFRDRRPLPLCLAVAAAAIVVLTTHYPLVEKIGLATAVTVFTASITSSVLHPILSWKPLTFLGAISYPLYLVHAPIIHRLQMMTPSAMPWAHPALWQAPALVLSTILGWLIYRFVERPISIVAHKSKPQPVNWQSKA